MCGMGKTPIGKKERFGRSFFVQVSLKELEEREDF